MAYWLRPHNEPFEDNCQLKRNCPIFALITVGWRLLPIIKRESGVNPGQSPLL